jgi:cytochrome c biogenesis protein CcdA
MNHRSWREFLKVFAVVAGLVPIVVLAIISILGAAQLIHKLWHDSDDAWLAILSVVGFGELLAVYWWWTRRKQRM